MNKFYKQQWFWLMLIAVINFTILLVYLYDVFRFAIFRSECFWVAVGSVGTLISAIIATYSIRCSENIRKQKDTYEAFKDFKTRNYKTETNIEDYSIEEFAKNYIGAKELHKEQIEEINKYLCDIEQLATCVNTKVFDPITIYNMGGPFLINKFDLLYPIIQCKRQLKKRNTIYSEFEKMVETLKKLQNSK